MMNKKSRARTRHRRAHWKATLPPIVTCANPACGLPTTAHAACRNCGTYRGRKVLPPR